MRIVCAVMVVETKLVKLDAISRIKKLISIENTRIAELMREKKDLERRLERAQKDFRNCSRNCDKRRKENIQPDNALLIRRAMITHGEINDGEVYQE